MNIQFATCQPHRALEYIKRVYPKCDPEKLAEAANPLLAFVEADVVRVEDPMMYGSRIGIVPGTHWDEGKREAVIEAGKLLHAVGQSSKEEAAP